MTKTDKSKKKKEAMILALQKTLGVVTHACKIADISRETFYKWIKEDEKFASRVKEMPEIVLDFAESNLYKLIQDRNPTAIIFFLKTKGRHRGYQENYDITTKGDKITKVIFVD